jgi:hypothetical protein
MTMLNRSGIGPAFTTGMLNLHLWWGQRRQVEMSCVCLFGAFVRSIF